MSGALEQVRAAAVTRLKECGVEAVKGMEPEARLCLTGPAAAVSLSGVRCAPGGFQDYLGVKNGDELYGRRMELTLTLDLYAPRSGGESACREAFAILAEALACGDLAGLPAEEITAGRVEFLHKDGLYRLPVTCRCGGWMVARVDDSGAFSDFEVEGKKI